MDETLASFLYLVAGSLIAGLVTYRVAKFYYEQAADDLKAESRQLRRLNEIMLNGMQNNGWIDLNRNEHGEIVGLNVTVAIKEGVSAAAEVGIVSPKIS